MPRSDPLILKDGEPKTLLPVQENHEPWMLSVRNFKTGKRKVRKFFSYQEAREAETKAKEVFDLKDGWDVVVISRQVGYGPPHSRISDAKLLSLNEDNQWWCPYCRKFREFLWLPKDELKHCPHCEISELDFHVKRCNPILWDPDKQRSVAIERHYEEES